MTARASRLWAALVGVVSAVVVLGVAEVAALLTGNPGSPLFAVGSLVIDLAPPGAKDFMIALFGTGDKAALLTLLGILIVVGSGLAGMVERARPPFGVLVFGVAALVALIAVISRADASPIDALPTIVGAVAGVIVLRIGIRRLAAWRRAQEKTGDDRLERRGFLRLTVTAGAVTLLAGLGARAINGASTVVTEARKRIKLPAPTTTAPPVPAGASLDVPGLSPLVTPNSMFYRIDTALVVPSVDETTWKLRVHGMVENPVEIDFAELLKKPLTQHMTTLTCVSNDVGGDLIGNALWLGWPIRELLAQAKPKAGADMVLSTSVDGFTAGTPLDVLQDAGTEALLAVGMNGKPLPAEHGFPVRMVVPGLYGYVSATKWVVDLEVTQFAKAEGYWTPRGWDAKGPIKLSSRIDTPTAGATVSAKNGTVAIAGVAWCQHVGVSRVQVQIDNGAWQTATLADSISADTWRQWVYRWTPTKGKHSIQVRATDANGNTQRSTYVPPAPNGSEGWDRISVTVA
ncbi:MAG: oxidoreductase [Frankiales bacterium]|nr:oxidoreductase [Frankiales bacterium]